MRKQWIPFIMMLTLLFQVSSLISVEENYTELARDGTELARDGRGGGGGGRGVGGGRAAGARPAAQRAAINNRGVGSLQRTPSMSRANVYQAGKAVGATRAANVGGSYGGYSYATPSYYYPTQPYYYYYPYSSSQQENK